MCDVFEDLPSRMQLINTPSQYLIGRNHTPNTKYCFLLVASVVLQLLCMYEV